jgi:hypothetical protein
MSLSAPFVLLCYFVDLFALGRHGPQLLTLWVLCTIVAVAAVFEAIKQNRRLEAPLISVGVSILFIAAMALSVKFDLAPLGPGF